MVLDASKAMIQKKLLTAEMDACHIRLNQRPPDISIKKKKTGGVAFTATCELTHIDEKQVKSLLHMYKIHNADILFREDATVQQFIDVLLGCAVYVPCVYVINKVDTIHLQEVDQMARMPYTCVISAHHKWNLDMMLDMVWNNMDVIRVYTKPQGRRPEFSEPLILRRGATIKDVCMQIHRTFASRFKYALAWGSSAKHQPQRVGISHVLEDEDVVQLMASK
jgi:developmentally-regulated GTP-binding protein 2